MAFNFFGALGNVARVLPGYMNGYRAAIQDNWNDLNQYNGVWGGQLSNLFNEATFTPAVDLYNAQSRIGQYNSYNMGLHTLGNFANMPAKLTEAAQNGAYAGPLGTLMKQAQMNMAQNIAQGGGLGGLDPNVLNYILGLLRQSGVTGGQAQAPGQAPSGA